jgi:SAM-dependent methyltransferase
MEGLDLEKQIEREFLSMPLRPGTMTFYTVRMSILAAVKEATAKFFGDVLDVGCGFMPYRTIIESIPAVKSYTGMDLEQATYYGDVEPDLKWDGQRIPREDGSFDCVIATEFLEHYPEPEKVLAEVRRVMRPGGWLFATVPFIWNLHEVPYDEYRYTPYSIRRHFGNAGFDGIEIKPLGGWNLAFAQMIGLWLGFAPMRPRLRQAARLAAFPFYKWLIRNDRLPDDFDGAKGSMFPGLKITARR